MSKLVVVINRDLAIGLAANTAAILTLSLGAKHPELIGPALRDHSGQEHAGITSVTIPVLATDDATLVSLVDRARQRSLELVGFSKIAQSIHSYQDYAEALAQTPADQINYSGVALFGPDAAVSGLVGNLPRLK